MFGVNWLLSFMSQAARKNVTVTELSSEPKTRKFMIRHKPGQPVEFGPEHGLPRIYDEWPHPYTHESGKVLVMVGHREITVNGSEFVMLCHYANIETGAVAILRDAARRLHSEDRDKGQEADSYKLLPPRGNA